MIAGLIIGKFHPLHTGHLGLIHFGIQNCDTLTVLICASDKENIAGEIRLKWLQDEFEDHPKIDIKLLNYDENELPNTSVSSREVSRVWAKKLKEIAPQTDVVFTSEPYGDYLAEYMNCRHIIYELERTTTHISASQILKNPFKYWDYIAASAQPFFIKKIVICGTESTGKSTLTERLAKHFDTAFVPEMARDILEHTEDCKPHHLVEIAQLHAQIILQKVKGANKLLFIDTDVNITKSYSKFLFGETLNVSHWIEKANIADAYIYLDNDAPHIQDGTRLDIDSRNQLHISHQAELDAQNISYQIISGNWDERFEKSIAFVKAKFNLL
jgi:HTH-type transcriptional regulator, transcriptional repressor of NAD biosynthesis genes